MNIYKTLRGAARASFAAVVILIGCHGGANGDTHDGGPDGAPGAVAWTDYVGFDGEHSALNVGVTAGNYLDAIKGRAEVDSKLDAALKTTIQDRCDELQHKRFASYTNDEAYLILVVAERHSAAGRWNQLWSRLGGTTATDPSWGAGYKPTSSKIDGYKKNVESLLDAIKAIFPTNATIVNRCNECMKAPHKTTNRNTSWARIALAYEYANNNKPNLVGEELDHPEAKTK